MRRPVKHREEIYARRRIEAVTGLLALGFALLIVRALDLQWYQADRLKQLAERQRHREYAIPAPRGPILDAKGRVLAESVRVPSIAAMADEVPAERVAELARALGKDAARLKRLLSRRRGFVWLARQVSPATADKVMALNIPGVRRETEWRRYYPLGPATGHLLGFVGVDGHGLEGLEHDLDAVLAGRAGRMRARRDARGATLPGGEWLSPPRPGREVRLTLDATIQSLAYAALVEGVRRMRARGGSVVVMNPADGAVLAMANWPGFNPNDFHRYRPGQWRNRAVTDVVEPGSVLKPFAVAAALETGRWRRDSRLFCERGRFRVADYVIHDVHAEGWLDMTGILARSSNICAAKLALDVGPERLHDMLRRAGFGRRTGIGLAGESPGILPPPDRWGPVETATIAFGQGVAVTPLQIAAAFSVLARDGQWRRPRILAEAARAGSDGVRQVMSARVARAVRRMLVHAASPEGTGALAVPAGYQVAGKTGTAQKPDGHGGYARDRFTAVFAGMAPADDPRLVIVVVMDEPKASIYGGKAAAPVFRRIAETALPYLGVAPSPAGVDDDWRRMPVRAGAEDLGASEALSHSGALPSLYGMSLREVRRFAAGRGLLLRVHGSGWVVRQKPAALGRLDAGGVLEVWLDD